MNLIYEILQAYRNANARRLTSRKEKKNTGLH